ncbi:hypothetical protein BH11BAC2_BH11BAC2_12130 [soil metagenome]
MFGLIVIVASVFIAVACYWIVPDHTPFSNTMSLPVSLQHPGFKSTFLKIPRKEVESANFFERMISGSPAAYSYIPLQRWQLKGDTIYYEEFSGDLSVPGLNGQVPILALAGAEILQYPTSEREKIIQENYIVQKRFILGTDRFGRDLFSRLMVGTRVSLSVGLIAVVISLIIGIALGSLAGYFRGWVDKIIVWVINVVWSIPTLLLVVAITMALGKGFAQVFIAVGLTMWVEVARLVRGQFFALREQQFVEAGRALGYRNGRIILKHILPNIIGPVIVIAASNFASAILLEAGLSFLGMGAQPPMPSWGMMIKENYGYIVVDAAYLAIWPGIAIATMVLSFTLLGNGLRDAFDARSVSGT